MVENLIPELTEAELARPRTDAEWTSLLSRMHEGIVKWSRTFGENQREPIRRESPGGMGPGPVQVRVASRGEGISEDIAKTDRPATRRDV